MKEVQGAVFPKLCCREAFTFLQLHLVAAFEVWHYFVFAPLFDLKLKGLEFLTGYVEQRG